MRFATSHLNPRANSIESAADVKSRPGAPARQFVPKLSLSPFRLAIWALSALLLGVFALAVGIYAEVMLPASPLVFAFMLVCLLLFFAGIVMFVLAWRVGVRSQSELKWRANGIYDSLSPSGVGLIEFSDILKCDLPRRFGFRLLRLQLRPQAQIFRRLVKQKNWVHSWWFYLFERQILVPLFWIADNARVVRRFVRQIEERDTEWVELNPLPESEAVASELPDSDPLSDVSAEGIADHSTQAPLRSVSADSSAASSRALPTANDKGLAAGSGAGLSPVRVKFGTRLERLSRGRKSQPGKLRSEAQILREVHEIKSEVVELGLHAILVDLYYEYLRDLPTRSDLAETLGLAGYYRHCPNATDFPVVGFRLGIYEVQYHLKALAEHNEAQLVLRVNAQDKAVMRVAVEIGALEPIEIVKFIPEPWILAVVELYRKLVAEKQQDSRPLGVDELTETDVTQTSIEELKARFGLD